MRISRPVRVGLELVVSGGLILYLLWRIDLSRTLDLIGSSNGWDLLGAFAIFVVTTGAMAWRWQELLSSKGIREPLRWLTKLYFVSYAASQVLPTVIGGDAVRIAAHARRRPDAKSEAAAAVLMERVVGSAGTLLLVAERTQLVAAEEIRVTRDDRRLLGDLLLPDANGAALFRPLVEVPLQLLLELRRAADRSRRHREDSIESVAQSGARSAPGHARFP